MTGILLFSLIVDQGMERSENNIRNCIARIVASQTSSRKRTTLLEILFRKEEHVAELVQSVGADKNLKADVLYMAIEKNVNCVDRLLQGAHVNEMQRLLAKSARKGYEMSVKLLLEKEEIWSDESRKKAVNDSLVAAVIGGHVSCTEILIRAGAGVNEMNQSQSMFTQDPTLNEILIHAVKNRHHWCVELLLKMGADVNVVDQQGKSLLYYAVEIDLVALGLWE